MNTIIPIIGIASGVAANDSACEKGPAVVQQSHFLKELQIEKPKFIWQDVLYPLVDEQMSKLQKVTDICQRLAQQTQRLALNNQFFVTVGGDHAYAIGTWSGVAKALEKLGELGLIWVDAHMDSHTLQSTLTGNIHGMPLAALLGYGDSALTQLTTILPVLKPTNICLIGVRSYEAAEAALLKQLGVRIFYISEVKERGLSAVFQEALQIVKAKTAGYGISIDIDAIDPEQAPGVGCREADGLHSQALVEILRTLVNDEQLMAAEIMEFNPVRDKEQRTEKIIVELLHSLAGD